MSVYRSFQRALPNDVFAAPVKDAGADSNAASQVNPAWMIPDATTPAASHFVAQRNIQQPRNTLLPYTAQWAAALPVIIRPHVLLRDFPRIANMIALLWTEPTKGPLRGYFDSLMVDQRGGRKGFPPAIALDLLGLREFYDYRYRSPR